MEAGAADHAKRHPLDILLVEDNALNQKLALRLPSRMGYGAKPIRVEELTAAVLATAAGAPKT